jgi:prevent-host-death family protein
MKSVKIAELKDKLSEYLRAAEAGDEVIVTDRNRPIARISPVGAPAPELQFEEPHVAFKTVRSKKWPAAGWRLTANQLVGAERRER